MTDNFAELIDAMGDPFRLRVLRTLVGRARGTSVREIAEALGEPQRKVRYHLDVLAGQQLVAVDSEAQRRGVVERFYRVARIPFISKEQESDISEDQLWKIATQNLRVLVADLGAAFAAKTFLRPGFASVHVPCDLDHEGWDELSALHEEFLEKVQTSVERSRRRLRSSEEEPITAVSVGLLFEMPGRTGCGISRD